MTHGERPRASRSSATMGADGRGDRVGLDLRGADRRGRERHRFLICGHELRRHELPGELHARESGAPEIVITAQSLNIGACHCLVSLSISASHGLPDLAAPGSPPNRAVDHDAGRAGGLRLCEEPIETRFAPAAARHALKSLWTSRPCFGSEHLVKEGRAICDPQVGQAACADV
jgi:hypothetical protein